MRLIEDPMKKYGGGRDEMWTVDLGLNEQSRSNHNIAIGEGRG